MKNRISQVQIQSALSKPLEVYNGLRQGDAVAGLLFKIALEKAVCFSGIQTTSHVFNKSVQLLVYADDIDLIAMSEASLKQTFLQLESAARMMGLRINQSKTMYMPVCTRRTSNITYLEVDIHKFKCERALHVLALK
jgi:hypothetical protein